MALGGFCALTMLMINGCTKIKLLWAEELYIDESVPTYEYIQTEEHLFTQGIKPWTYVGFSEEFDFAKEATQL